jgi:hypothetical protein
MPWGITPELIAHLSLIGVVFLSLQISAAVLVYMERKVAAFVQQRYGPYLVGPLGLLQPIADIVKLIFKEELRPAAADKWLFYLAPVISATAAFSAFAVVPFGAETTFLGLLDERLQLGLAFARDENLRTQLRTDATKGVVDIRASGIHLRRDLQFNHRFVELARGLEPPRARVVILRGTQLCALERQLCGAIVRVSFERCGVFRDRAVVVLLLFGLLAGAVRGSRGAPRKSDGERQGGREAASSVSHQ